MLFEFELANVEDILPWGEPGKLNLSWFALTDGRFRMVVGEQVLFRYTNEILTHWGQAGRDADYQIAAFARDMLGSVAAAVAPLPPRVEQLAIDWQRLWELQKPTDDVSAQDDLWYDAWRWLGERSPWTSYLTACPTLYFVRIGKQMRIHWENREKEIDGIPVWSAQQGVHEMSVDAFLNECSGFAQRLLSAMHDRITAIEDCTVKPQVEVSISSLRDQHEKWRAELASYFGEHQPDISWQQTENALRTIAEKKRLHF